jgi:hypothetical protein
MKKITLILLLSALTTAFSQGKFETNNGIIRFEASVPLFEEVKAKNEEVLCILDPKTSTISCVVLMKRFRFKMNLMETHFNENYMESNRYPKAIFKGKIEKFDLKDIDAVAKEYQIRGKLHIHGKSKTIVVLAKLKKANQGIEFTASFALNTDDFRIEIPSIVRSKISKNVNTEISCLLQ